MGMECITVVVWILPPGLLVVVVVVVWLPRSPPLLVVVVVTVVGDDGTDLEKGDATVLNLVVVVGVMGVVIRLTRGRFWENMLPPLLAGVADVGLGTFLMIKGLLLPWFEFVGRFTRGEDCRGDVEIGTEVTKVCFV